ncbi:MAG: PEGA domain-containing protein, partial [Polyangiaceae bacterium]
MERRTTGLSSKILAGIITGALVFAQVPAAWAQPRPAPPISRAELASAKKHYGEGEKKYKAGDYVGAEADFKVANDIKAAPQTERFIGLCEDRQGHLQSAVEWFDRFLVHVPDKMAEQGDEIRKREGEIKAMPGKVHVESTPPGAMVTIDDKPQPGPTPLDVELAPGSHAVKLAATGHVAQTKTIDVAFA